MEKDPKEGLLLCLKENVATLGPEYNFKSLCKPQCCLLTLTASDPKPLNIF